MKKVVVIFTVFIFCKTVAAQNVGIGVPDPTQKLDVAGNVKISGAIMPGGAAGVAGQVLTSSGANAAPIWTNPAFTGGGRFWIIPANNFKSNLGSSGRAGWIIEGSTSPVTQNDSLDFGTTNVSGTDFTVSNPGFVNNFITVNRTGLYHFEGTLRYRVSSSPSVYLFSKVALEFVANQPTATDLSILLIDDLQDLTNSPECSACNHAYAYTGRFQLNIHLQAGSTCTFITGFNNLSFPNGADLVQLGILGGGYVSGHFISE